MAKLRNRDTFILAVITLILTPIIFFLALKFYFYFFPPHADLINIAKSIPNYNRSLETKIDLWEPKPLALPNYTYSSVIITLPSDSEFEKEKFSLDFEKKLLDDGWTPVRANGSDLRNRKNIFLIKKVANKIYCIEGSSYKRQEVELYIYNCDNDFNPNG